jgi:hypothetical protein
MKVRLPALALAQEKGKPPNNNDFVQHALWNPFVKRESNERREMNFSR